MATKRVRDRVRFTTVVNNDNLAEDGYSVRKTGSREVSWEVTDAELLEAGYRKKTPWRPVRMTAYLQQSEDQPWTVRSVVISGPNIKKDGTDGLKTESRHITAPWGKEGLMEGAPAWAEDAYWALMNEVNAAWSSSSS